MRQSKLMKIFAFGFKGNLSSEVLAGLNVDKTAAIESSEGYIRACLANMKLEEYDFVIGMGAYSGDDKAKIRIETICTSQFRNNTDNLEKIEMKPFFKAAHDFKRATRMGNSYCNLVSYLITTKYPKLRFTFLHIPHNFPIKIATAGINRQIGGLQL